MKRIITSSFVVLALIVGAAGCSSSSKISSGGNAGGTVAAQTDGTTASAQSGTTPIAVGGSGVASVDAFCKKAQEIIAALKQGASADQTKLGEDMAQLGADEANLISSHPGDANKIYECYKQLQTALGG